ncbi:MAG TPA: hypothetical protein VGM06_12035 [Polyangiaceae bacterium]|jgi:hypothetical protein
MKSTRYVKLLVRGALGASTAVAISAALSLGCSSDDTSTPVDGGTSATTTDGGTLYQRLGGHAGIRAAVNQIVAAELTHMDIASYFFFQAGAPANGHPTEDQVEECFTDLVANAAGGTETYPTTIMSDAGVMYTCRDLTTLHAPLLISGGTFDEFVMIAGAELTSLGVSSTDVGTLANALASTKGAVVTPALTDAGAQAYPGDGG